MTEINVGIIAAPEFPTKLANEIKTELPKEFRKELNAEYTWHLEKVTDGLISIAEDEDELLDGVNAVKKEKGWDYTICLTDIPIFYDKKVILARLHPEYDVAVIALPALGWFVDRRAIDVVRQVMADLYFEGLSEAEEEMNEEFSFRTIKKVSTNEENKYVIRYYFASRPIGLLTMLAGMTYDNQPWRIMYSLKSVIAIAFGSGAYGMIFPTLWGIGYHYSTLRLTIYMFLAIVGLGLWIIQGHNLWETDTVTDDNTYRRLYNAATITTLLLAVSIFYGILFLLFVLTAFIFIDPHYFMEQVGTSHLPTFVHYLEVAWITTSVGTLTGAVGVGLENEESVRQTTYGYRQRERYKHKKKRKEGQEESDN